jgi:hypothetical protein
MFINYIKFPFCALIKLLTSIISILLNQREIHVSTRCLENAFCHVHKLLFALSNRIIQFKYNAVSTQLNHRRTFLLSIRCGVGSLLCMWNINCQSHWLAICCLSRIYHFSLDRQFRSFKTIWYLISIRLYFILMILITKDGSQPYFFKQLQLGWFFS